MLTVKIRKEELEDGDIPSLCMICGDKDAETKVPFVARKLGFPLSAFGIIGKFLTPKKYEMSVLTCGQCKSPFIYEQTMANIWLSLRLVATLALLYVVVADSENAPANLLIPIIIVFSTLLLESVYFWTIGRRNAVRVSNIEENSVALDLPNEGWPAAYTKYRREKEMSKHRERSTGSMAPPV